MQPVRLHGYKLVRHQLVNARAQRALLAAGGSHSSRPNAVLAASLREHSVCVGPARVAKHGPDWHGGVVRDRQVCGAAHAQLQRAVDDKEDDGDGEEPCHHACAWRSAAASVSAFDGGHVRHVVGGVPADSRRSAGGPTGRAHLCMRRALLWRMFRGEEK